MNINRMRSYFSGRVYKGKNSAWCTDFPITSYIYREDNIIIKDIFKMKEVSEM